METALYFPYIRVPETVWFTRILLYWDAAASIVPRHMRDYETEIGSNMKNLIKAGLVNPIPPGSGSAKATREYDERFLALLDAQEVTPIFTQNLQSNRREMMLHPERWSRLHQEKGSFRLFKKLEDRGLAVPREVGDYSEWWAVENRTAELYMPYLVGSICRQNRGLYPVTDSSDNIRSLTAPATADMATRLRELRYVAIREALPAPSRPVSVTELRSFRDSHGEELRRLRRYLNSNLVYLAEIDDDRDRHEMTQDVLQGIRDDVAVLTEQMKKRRWPKITLIGVGGLVGSALATAAAIASGGAALVIGLGVASGSVYMTQAGATIVDLIRSPRFDESAPLAYAALAQAL
jgi:hypothetical protein